MNSTTRTLVLAAPLAALALGFGGATAQAATGAQLDITNPVRPTHPDGGRPTDIAIPQDDDDPQGPGDLTNGDPKPTDHPNGGGSQGGGSASGSDVQLPNRIDAGFAGEADGLDLTWAMAGGAVVSAAAAAAALRARRSA